MVAVLNRVVRTPVAIDPWLAGADFGWWQWRSCSPGCSALAAGGGRGQQPAQPEVPCDRPATIDVDPAGKFDQAVSNIDAILARLRIVPLEVA
jgi:hypothetical protein